MAIGEVHKMWSRSGGEFASEDLLERRARFRDGYTIDHAAGEPMDNILKAVGTNGIAIPQIGSIHENNPFIFCKRVVPQRGLILTFLDVEYEGEVGPAGIDGSPIDDLPDYEFSNVTSEEPMDEAVRIALDGNIISQVQIATVNGESIQGVTKPVSDILLTVDRNYIDVNLPATEEYLDSVSSDAFPPFKPFPAGTAHLQAFRAKPQLLPQGAIKYWRVHAEIVFRRPFLTIPERAWWSRRKHEGYQHLVDKGGADERVVNITDDDQADTSKPIALDADGVKVADPTTKENILFMEFQRFENVLPYNALGLF